MLEAKGYTPLGVKEIRIPFNTLIRKYDEKRVKAQIEKGEKNAHDFAVDLAEGEAQWFRIPLLPDLARWAFGSRRAWRFYGDLKLLHRDDEKCTGRGLY